MNHRMPILDPAVSFSWADDYPVQLFLFPVYLFAMIPSFNFLNVKEIVMGNEMDDPLETAPYKGIKHYFGVYDQSLDFQKRFSQYMDKKALASIYGLLFTIFMVLWWRVSL